MSKFTFKTLKTVLFVGILAPTTYFAYDGYKKSIEPSNFELAAGKLGFNGYKKADQSVIAATHQEAFLKQLQIAGYFHPEKLWQDINRLGVKDPVTSFKQIYSAIKKSKADQDDPSQFNAKILRKNLVKGEGAELDQQDVMDLLLYISQNAFGRKSGQERNELASQDWMNKYKGEYLANAKILGLIDREIPKLNLYDDGWIAGASRIGIMARIIDYCNMLSKYDIKVHGDNTELLAGARELWANIDGIIPIVRDRLIEAYKTKKDLDELDVFLSVGEDGERVKEGEEYMAALAARSDIKLNPLDPFIQCKQGECPAGRFPNRTYANYADGVDGRLTETLMSQDLANSFLPNSSIVDTSAEKHQRPTTASTARDAATKFMERAVKGDFGDKTEFVILFETNNPYIERQTLAAQREVNKVVKDYNKLHNTNYTINLEGVGFKCKQDVVTVHSELGALVTEKWKDAMDGTALKHPIEKLLFQSRDNSLPVPPMPEDISKVNVLGDLFQDLFDAYLE